MRCALGLTWLAPPFGMDLPVAPPGGAEFSQERSAAAADYDIQRLSQALRFLPSTVGPHAQVSKARAENQEIMRRTWRQAH